ncbi:18783_t:CDS:2 [Acaulospora morrowiae]|uniref:18783_t:CDS:1 n=1 Tax=Acaulospora morrowiae TaxID=94023 RepID=A0A9N8YYA9_9GLOM|nr:18783_t:CDS:2 [Acaulospora morrowiae]
MENESFLNRFRCAIIEPVRFAFGMWSINEDLNKIWAQTGVDTVINTYEIIKNSLFLVNTFFGFEVPHPMSPLIQEIGPVMQDEYPILTPNLLSFVSTHKKFYTSPLVMNCILPRKIMLFSYKHARRPFNKNHNLMRFSSKPLLFPMGHHFSTTGILSNQHPDILVSRFTSQFSVLNHTNVKIFNNAEKLERLGVGLTINRLNLDVKDILSNIKLLLADQSIQNNLKKTKVLARINSKRKYRAAYLIEYVMRALTLNLNYSLDVDGGEIGGGRNNEGLLKEWTAPEMRMGLFRGKYFDIYLSFWMG